MCSSMIMSWKIQNISVYLCTEYKYIQHIKKSNYLGGLFFSNTSLSFFNIRISITKYIRVMKVLKNLEYHHWHSLKSKLDYQWPTCPKRTGKEFEKQDLQSSKVFPSAQGKMGWNGQPFSGFHTSKNENAFKLSYVWEVPWESNLRG